MILEHRLYTFRPGMVPRWLDKYRDEGLPIQQKHLGTFVGVFVAEIGHLHTILLMWAYDSLADRERRRAAMSADPEWQKFIGEVWALEAIIDQRVTIMNPAEFNPPANGGGTAGVSQ
jgi:NIPSNAP